MDSSEALVRQLEEVGVRWVFGVPDSTLSELGDALDRKIGDRHIIAPNEGSAVSLAIGSFIGLGALPAVYMQNSGLSNALNPLLSHAHKDVYSIPMLLIIGWRGELLAGSQKIDEPQHLVQGRITQQLLELSGIPHEVLMADDDIKAVITRSARTSIKEQQPTAVLIPRGFLSNRQISQEIFLGKEVVQELPTREAVIRTIVSCLPSDDFVVATTGFSSRELYEIRMEEDGLKNDFLSIGGMGHASAIAIGIALVKKRRKVICLDGDGSALMHLGNLALGARINNLVHILVNNRGHDSVGGQPTCNPGVSFASLAASLGYTAKSVFDLSQLATEVQIALESDKATFLEVKCRRLTRSDLRRPKAHPKESLKELRQRVLLNGED